MQDSAGEGETQIWIDRIWKDPSCHMIFANFVLKVNRKLNPTVLFF